VQLARVSRRRSRSFDIADFIDDLQRSYLVLEPPSDVAELFDSTPVDLYDKTLAELGLLDKHAPWQRDLQLLGSTESTLNAVLRK